MKKESAGILLFRRKENLEFFLIHPGGPFFALRDEGVWSIPKGEIKEEEDARETAKREFQEETSFKVPESGFIELSPVSVSNKIIFAWGVEGDVDPEKLKSNTFKMWGKEFPEADRGGWFRLEEAKKKISSGQLPFLEELKNKLEN